MPTWEKSGGLRPAEIESIISYLRPLGGTPAPADNRPARWVSGNAAAGRQLYQATCSGCHGANGEGGEGLALNNPVLLANATDTYLVETIARGRRGTAMAPFAEPSPVHPALASNEIESITTYIRSWEAPIGGKQ